MMEIVMKGSCKGELGADTEECTTNKQGATLLMH